MIFGMDFIDENIWEGGVGGYDVYGEFDIYGVFGEIMVDI